MSCVTCVVDNSQRIGAGGKLVATLTMDGGLSSRPSSISSIRSRIGLSRPVRQSLSATSKFIADENVNFGISREFVESVDSYINSSLSVSGLLKSRLSSDSKLKVFPDKFAGYKPTFRPHEKLYPVQDVSFTNKSGNNISVYKSENGAYTRSNIYTSLDEGIFVGDYTEHGKPGSIISDDSSSLAFTYQVFSSGDLQYKFRVTNPTSVAKLSYLAVRASASFDSYSKRKPQEYKIYDIKLEDPSGNLIIQYEDITIYGDNNYTTYISKPSINNLLLPTWNPDYPIMGDSGAYTLTLNITFNCNRYPFSTNFDSGYEQSCIINNTQLNPNPFISLNISAIEIGNSGGVGILKDNYIGLFTSVVDQPNRITRTVLPNKLLTYNFDNGIYPQSISTWESVINDVHYSNTSESDSQHLLNKIRNNHYSDYITLSNSYPVQNSGRIILKFDTTPSYVKPNKFTGGAFNFGGSTEFNDSKLTADVFNDNLFHVDFIELKIIAKKASNSQDYPIDVVGYSDDKLLFVTPPIGGFLQNSGALDFDSNQVPNSSGFYTRSFGFSDGSLSELSNYFEQDISLNGDHYALSSYPVVNSTSFKEYTIPLKIYQNPNKLGYTNYSISSFFENLYLDISPLPSGASICHVRMLLHYVPSDGMMLHTLGSPSNKNAIRKHITLLPSSNGTINSSSLDTSSVVGVTTPLNLATNYSRRWRSHTGDIFSGGDFDRERFDFSFNHQQAYTPFSKSYIDFTKWNGQNIYDHKGLQVGSSINSDLDILSNFGWRYSSTQLIDGITTEYSSLSWNNNIHDNFDRALRIGNDYVNTNFLTSPNNDFVLFFRYTPDKVSDAQLKNHLIMCCEDGDWSIVVVVENEYLKLKVNNTNSTISTITDSIKISQYSFPLPILITYNSTAKKFKLYTDNELIIPFDRLRGEVTINSYDSSTINFFGYSNYYTSLGSIPMFLHEIGYSSGCNIVDSNPNRFLNQITADDFFNSYSVLSQNVDDDISKWKLGDFKVCQFSPDFDFFTKRVGKDFITFNLSHSGSGYDQTTNLVLPSNINLSGVAYHTQLENDFLRFDLSDVPTIDKDRFYAISPRICKVLPKGYDFNYKAIYVDTIVEHETNNNITWNDGNVGPKLIVSLYTTTKDHNLRPDKKFGLINRSVHYLEPSGCIRKLTSKFTFDDLVDQSEPWAIFDKETYSEEFKERYFSKDIDDMFLQYDISYPSGSPFSSLIKIHNANVNLGDSIFLSSNEDDQLNITTSGSQYQLSKLNLFSPISSTLLTSDLGLRASGDRFFNSNNISLIVNSSGIFGGDESMSIYARGIGSIDTGDALFGGDIFGVSPNRGPTLFVRGEFIRESEMPLSIFSANKTKNSSTILYINGDQYPLEQSLNLSVRAVSATQNYFPNSSLCLFIGGFKPQVIDSTDSILPLSIKSQDFSITKIDDSINIFTLNYPISSSLSGKSATIRWDSDNMGNNISSSDNVYAYVDSNDNIRGVDLLCYGNCNSSERCYESVIDIHGLKWYDPEVCVDGGVFRAKTTYTNLVNPSGSFRHTLPDGTVTYDPLPYSGHFYGIRKYTGLAPNLPYVINIEGQTGSSDAISIPTEITGIEYNKLEDDETSLDYSGFRISASGNYKNNGDEFGKSVASKEDLLVIGAPKRSINYNQKSNVAPFETISYNLSEAGTVFIYKRDARPSGNNWPQENYKSSWRLESALTLPSGLLKDYSIQTEIDKGFPDNLKPIQTQWFVGQEGRQFGHSVDLSINKNKKSLGEDHRQVLVVGGPSAKWTPQIFDDSEPSGVNIGLMIFTDEFMSRIPAPLPGAPFRTIGYEEVLRAVQDKDIVFNYFANPRIKFNVKLIICQPIADNPDIFQPDFPDKPSFITLKSIRRNSYPKTEEKTSGIFNDIKEAFFEAFPHDPTKIHSNIPPLLGLYVDNSMSLGRRALTPALDRFINFYKDYSFASGLKDYRNTARSSGEVIEYIPDDYDAENWVQMSTTILSEVLSTGNLVKNDQVRLLTGTVGTFDPSIKSFNIPPESGGKVYIFEKESGSWNLIQEIKSPNVTYDHPDRFGHAVSISDDGDVIAVGSPYISQALNIYERNDAEKDRLYYNLYSWAKNKYPVKYAKEISSYEYAYDGSLNAAKSLYLSLDKEDKFKSRLDLGIEEYKNIYIFDYNNMQPNGSWSFIPQAVAPTSRLGYSVDVNEDGSIVAAGSPTDSMNLYNDSDIYYSHNASYRGKYYAAGYSDPSGIVPNHVKSSWSSSVNAGSIHVFESRKYYPHDTVIEYGRFGNLHEDIGQNTADSGHFNYISEVFSDKKFIKTPFSQNSIPKEAGLMFIITPKINSLSDEVYQNIYNWLALGDRNLVLVGNDPTWESSGIYKESNNIINNLLERLNSRMRIVAARNSYEALSSGYSSFNNIIPSFVPQGSTSTYISRTSLKGSGVGDIRIYYPGFEEYMPCEEVDDCTTDPAKIQLQSRCEMPLIHYGDLRAQWNASCCTNGGMLVYGVNWPLKFGSYTPQCGDTAFSTNPLKNFEPIPLLAAAEKVKQEIIYPAVPEQYKTNILYNTIYENTPYFIFGSPVSDVPNFIFDSNNDIEDYSLNITPTNNGAFYRPEVDGILQAKAVSKIDLVPYLSKEIVSDKSYYCAEYNYKKTNSKIIILAGVETESQRSLYSGLGDRNVKFYMNLVSKKNKIGESVIAQLGSWTQRNSFKSGYSDSILRSLFLNDNTVFEDVDTSFSSIEKRHLDNGIDIAWISNIISQPSDKELEDLKSWLRYDNKKLIITYSHNDDMLSVNNAKKLCESLEVDFETVYLPFSSIYPEVNTGSLYINQNHQIGGIYNNNLIEVVNAGVQFYPIKLTANAIGLAYDDQPIYEQVPKQGVDNYWQMKGGIAKFSFPVQAGSGYKLFVTTAMDSEYEKAPLFIDIEHASYFPNLPYPKDYVPADLKYINNDDEEVSFKLIEDSAYRFSCESSQTKTIDVQVGSGIDSINVYVSCNIQRYSQVSTYTPKSVKLVGISGVLVPVYETVSTSAIQIPVGTENVKTADAQPEYKELIEIIRPISTDNTKYCSVTCKEKGLGGRLIDDGPVVAAQEIEILSPFNAGVARSRITVISDSSMVQGKLVINENGIIPYDTYQFIRSLYPETDFSFQNYGRQFNVYNKLVAPERGSPSKYFGHASISGLNQNFGNSGNVSLSIINQYESKYDPKYITRPDIPWKDETDEEQITQIRNYFINNFLNSQLINHASTARFSGIIDGKWYSDATIAGGLPSLLKDKGYDYLDFDKFPSGYPGDLFGYSISVRGNKIVAGTPFSAFDTENVTPWTSGSQLRIGYDGGGGCVYMFEKANNLSWECSRKFKPSSLMGQLSGINSKSDHFGHSVSLQPDTLIIGAPNHDYGSYYEATYNDGSFSRKNFNPQFDIPTRSFYDLGLQGVRENLELDGIYGNNAGAIYVYENKISDWENKKQSWELVEKVLSDSANPNNERFGKFIHLTRPYRTDADYTIFAGCNFASGEGVANIGVTYAKDVMLREQSPSVANPNSWINAKVFGYRDNDKNPTIVLGFSNNNDGNKKYYASGLITSNNKGEIFVEISGQDPSTKGFIAHRPYIKSVVGYYQYGKLYEDNLTLFVDCINVPPSSEMPLFIDVENAAYVYNTLGLYSNAVSGISSPDPSGLFLYSYCPEPVSVISALTIYSSGASGVMENLNFAIRGK